MKHADADKITLFSELANGQANIHVRDNGSSFPDPADEQRVLRRLTGRVEGVGGLIVIESDDETGTEIKISVGV